MCEECGPTPPEDIAADAEFEAAIKKYMEHYGHTEGILVDWALVCAQNVIHEHIDTTYISHFARTNQPTYRTRGLLETHLTYLKTRRFPSDDE